MNPQIKQKWVSALRSGEYQQGQYCLRKEDGFCCLGVLCDLYGKENNVEWEPSTHYNNVYVFQDMATILPLSVMEWVGVGEGNPLVNDEIGTLAGLNDNGTTFNEIADVIEKQL
jgi:hypothetical protein